MKNLTLISLLLPLLASSSPADANNRVAKPVKGQTAQNAKAVAKDKSFHRRNGTPLKLQPMKAAGGKDIKLRTFQTHEATIQNAPVRVDPIKGTINAHGAEVTIHNTVQHGVDFSQRAAQTGGVAKPLGPNQVRNSLINGQLGQVTPGFDGKVNFPVAHPPNAPVVVQFKSNDPGHIGKQYSRVSVVKGKVRVKTIEGEGLFPKMVLSGGELAGEFKPYLNTNVIGVTPPFSPTGKRGPQIIVRGGVNSMPPGSTYRTVNMSTGKTSDWKPAHAETGSFRTSIPVKSTNDMMAIEVRTGTTTTEGSVITTNWTFKAPFGPTKAGRMPLMETAFATGETHIKGPDHPVTVKEHHAANAVIKQKLHADANHNTIASLYQNMGLTGKTAEAHEFSVLLAKVIKENPGIKDIHGRGNSTITYTLQGQTHTHRFQSDIASAKEWTFKK